MPTSSDSPVDPKSQSKPRVRIGVPHMSTGGKPPRPQFKLIDDEAEEASHDNEDDDDDEYESSFIDDLDVDKESPTPAPREATVQTTSTHSQDEVASSSSSRNKAGRETTPLTTRSQAKKLASTSTLSEDNGSGSSKAKGIRSSAIEKPPGDPGSQTQVATRPSGSETMPAITPELYDEFLKYRAALSEYIEFIVLSPNSSHPSLSRQNEMLSTPDSKRVAFEASYQSNDPMEVDEEEAEGSPQWV
ncbi:hypothetical protein B0H11DRAFT_1931168 [Mycena galericulata]|nr:hypothetical protein B0H11DRAFT_1931168 [Mycena galericulata]